VPIEVTLAILAGLALCVIPCYPIAVIVLLMFVIVGWIKENRKNRPRIKGIKWTELEKLLVALLVLCPPMWFIVVILLKFAEPKQNALNQNGENEVLYDLLLFSPDEHCDGNCDGGDGGGDS
jgi:hypothetical protein